MFIFQLMATETMLWAVERLIPRSVKKQQIILQVTGCSNKKRSLLSNWHFVVYKLCWELRISLSCVFVWLWLLCYRPTENSFHFSCEEYLHVSYTFRALKQTEFHRLTLVYFILIECCENDRGHRCQIL